MSTTENEQENDSKANNQDCITFDSFDKLNLRPFGESLFQNIEKGVASSVGQKGAYTISLNAEFGNGKTTFLEMFKNFIKSEKSKKYNVLFINAWESDFYKEPVIAILSELVNWMEINNKNKNQVQKIVGTILQIGLNLFYLVIGKTIQYKTGIDLNVKKMLETALKNLKNNMGQKVFENFKQRKQTIGSIKTAISECTKNKKLLIIVDELDRTRPDYAVRFLEDMKHFFDIENVVFLIAVNRTQMEATVTCLYGQDLDFNGYYRKFFKQERDLPDPCERAQEFIDALVRKTNVKFRQDHRHYRVTNCHLSCKMFNLTLREIESFIRIFEQILGSKHKNSAVPWIYQDCYSFFICLFLKEKKVFQQILNGSFTVYKFIQFMNQIKFDFKIDEDKYKYHSLLSNVAYSLMKNKKFQEGQELIQETFPVLAGGDKSIEMFSSDGFGGIYYDSKDQPALDICKTINQCKSFFS